MTVARMCRLGKISRATLYRFNPDRERPDKDVKLRDVIQQIALEFPCYRRLHSALDYRSPVEFERSLLSPPFAIVSMQATA